MLMDKKVSIIIPAYNVEKYIKECLESISNQTYKNIEVIIIDDGSIDNTPSIVKTFCDEDNRFRLLTNPNKGVSSARNYGISISSGRYIMFLDSDDFYDLNAVEYMLQSIIDNQCDWGICNYINKYDDSEENNNVHFIQENNKYDITDYLKQSAIEFNSLYVGVLWNKIYRSDIIKTNKILFDETINLGEDSLFNLEYIKYVKTIYISSKCLYYHYMSNENSLTKTISAINMWDMSTVRYEKMIEIYKRNQLERKCSKEIAYRILGDLIFPIRESIKDNKQKNEKVEILKNICQRNIVDYALKNLDELPMLYKIMKKNILKGTYVKLYYELSIWDKIKGLN